MISKEMESLEQLRLSKKLNDQITDLRSKNIKSISINSTKELILVQRKYLVILLSMILPLSIQHMRILEK